MFNIKVTGVAYEFDAEGCNAAMRKYIETQVKLAAKDFATTALSRIPIRTGFVAGAFGPLTELLGGTARLNPIVAFTRRVLSAAKAFLTNEAKAKSNQEYYYPSRGAGRILKTPTSGREFATNPEDVFRWEGDIYVFNYDVDITYFRINDSTPGHAPSAPWGAFEAGQAAFESRLARMNIGFDAIIEKYLTPIAVDRLR